MQRAHRHAHRRIWLVLGLLIPLGLILALWFRPPQPIEEQRPAGNITQGETS